MDQILFYMILVIISLCSIHLFKLLKKNGKNSDRLPGPFPLPVIGHLHLLAPLPHQALHKLSIQYGPLFEIFIGSVSCVIVSSPETAKEFLKTHEASFSNRPKMAAVDYITYGSKDFSFAPYGPFWKFMKKMVMSELLGGNTLDSLSPIRQDEVSRFVNKLSKKAQEGESVDVARELISVTNNVVSRMMMSERCSGNEEDAGEVRKLLLEIAELFAEFNLSDFIWFCKNLDLQGLNKKFKNVRDRFDAMMDRIIKEHEKKREKEKRNIIDTNEKVKDILDILLDVMEDKTSEIRLTKENIKAFVLDIFAAGTDASAFTIEWALSELINNPNIMEKAQQEIDNIVGKERLVQESDIANLPYLQAIVKETLRLHPTGPLIVRESSEECTIMGYKIPPKTRLFVNVWAIGRDPSHWDNPLEFRPERFFDEGEKCNNLDLRGQHFNFLPFGSGRRGCPGTSLALRVVQSTLATMVQCFEWRAVGNGSVDMEEGSGLTLPRAHHLVCTPVARISPFPSIEFMN